MKVKSGQGRIMFMEKRLKWEEREKIEAEIERAAEMQGERSDIGKGIKSKGEDLD